MDSDDDRTQGRSSNGPFFSSSISHDLQHSRSSMMNRNIPSDDSDQDISSSRNTKKRGRGHDAFLPDAHHSILSREQGLPMLEDENNNDPLRFFKRESSKYDDRDSEGTSPPRKKRKVQRSPSTSSESDENSTSSSSSESRRRRRKLDKHQREEKLRILEAETRKVEALVESNKTLGGRAGGVYIPPHRMALLKEKESRKFMDASSSRGENGETLEKAKEYQKETWEALRKSINGLVNKVSVQNIRYIAVELMKENVWRGRGLLCKCLMKSQSLSPKFTSVYTALVAVVNTKFPEIGLLLIKRLIDAFKKGYRRGDKILLLSSTKFLAHLVNQHVCDPLVTLEIMLTLLENPTEDSIEIACSLMQEMGKMLQETSLAAFNAIFDQFRSILHEGKFESNKRITFLIESLFAVRRSDFADFPAVRDELDLVFEEDQIVHNSVTLTNTDENEDDDQDDKEFKAKLRDVEEGLDYFKFDPNYEENEHEYQLMVDEMLAEGDGSSGSDISSSEDEDSEKRDKTVSIVDETSTELTILKRSIYLTIMSSRDHEEVAHKLMKMNLNEEQRMHVCSMCIQCCSQERTYLKFYSLIAQRFCMIDRSYQEMFEKLFAEIYTTVHRYQNNELRNISRLFAHLLFTDSIPWTVLQIIQLNERDTTASSRIFIKILFSDLAEYLGNDRLAKRCQDPRLLHPYMEGLFPTNTPKDCKFAIHFWTAIELGFLTDQLRSSYNEMIKKIAARRAAEAEARANRQSSSSETDSSDSGSDSDSDSSSQTSSSSSGSYSSSRS